MIAAAETPADFRQRARGQLLGEIHADLAGPDDRLGAPRRQEIGARDVVVTPHHLEDVVNADAGGLGGERDRAAPARPARW